MPDVELPGGARLRGTHQDGATAYLGVPYAEPPVGGLRSRLPLPAPGWTGVRDATRPGYLAPQTASRLETALGPQEQLPQSEDCLTLNVWAPPGAEGLPVLVFVHGGGFLTGGGGLDWYSGAALAARGDLVVVTVNYRLGFLGFGAAPDANAGVADVLTALRWVRANISAFGGDPDRVTVSGQSGGAYLIVALLGTPAADGLFRGVVLQSTPLGMAPQSADDARRAAAALHTALGRPPRDAPVEDLLAGQITLLRDMRAADPAGVAPPFLPVVDGDLVTADLAATAAARTTGVRILIGTTRDEGTAFFTDPGTAEHAAATVLVEPSEHFADLLARNGNPPWVYRFDWHPAGNPLGATHCMELPFVFGTAHAWSRAPMLAGADPGELAAMTELTQRCWTAFATGEPPHPGWHRWTAERPGALHLDTTPHWEDRR